MLVPVPGVFGGKISVGDHQQVLGVLLFGGRREVERSGDDDVPVDHRHVALDALDRRDGESGNRVHQSMILLAASRGEALKRFLVEDAAGNDPRFWTLAQALSALYPASTDEKRWVGGVLVRKKGLGF